MKAWGLDHKLINKVKDFKLVIEMAALKSWPRFTPYGSKLELRGKKEVDSLIMVTDRSCGT